MFTLDQIKIDLIKSHPTFTCPVTKEILDYRTSKIIKYKANNFLRTDIVSRSGLETLKQNGLFEKLSISIVQNVEEL